MDLENLQSDDGYACHLHHREIPDGRQTTLLIELSVEGTPMLSGDGSGVIVKTYDEITRIDGGKSCRDLHLARAICRYLNTGGSWDDVRDLADSIQQATPGPLIFPDGLQLARSIVEHSADCVAEHIFINEQTGQTLVWRENEIFYPSSLEAFDESMTEAGHILYDDLDGEEEPDDAEPEDDPESDE